MATQRNHQNNFATNLTSNQIAGVTTTPLNSIPSVAAPFSIALDATNINGKYEIVEVTSKTATNINHAATTYAHTTAEEVRMVVGADELDEFATAINTTLPGGWTAYTTVTPTTGTLDSPSFPIVFAGVDLTSSISVGMRVKITQSTDKYFIVTAIAFSTDTTITLYGGTDYSLVASGTTAISAFSYSAMKVPLGFPLDPTKWTVSVTDNSTRTQATPTQNTWYNITQLNINIPIGLWHVSYNISLDSEDAAVANNGGVQSTLSTANNTESNFYMTAFTYIGGATGTIVGYCPVYRDGILSLAAKATYYLNIRTQNTGIDNIRVGSTFHGSVVKAVCSYL